MRRNTPSTVSTPTALVLWGRCPRLRICRPTTPCGGYRRQRTEAGSFMIQSSNHVCRFIVGVGVLLVATAYGSRHTAAADHTMQIAQGSDAAKRLDQKLESFDPCEDDLKGMSAPGFTLACRTN